jgi:hypothetical protein
MPCGALRGAELNWSLNYRQMAVDEMSSACHNVQLDSGNRLIRKQRQSRKFKPFAIDAVKKVCHTVRPL